MEHDDDEALRTMIRLKHGDEFNFVDWILSLPDDFLIDNHYGYRDFAGNRILRNIIYDPKEMMAKLIEYYK